MSHFFKYFPIGFCFTIYLLTLVMSCSRILITFLLRVFSSLDSQNNPSLSLDLKCKEQLNKWHVFILHWQPGCSKSRWYVQGCPYYLLLALPLPLPPFSSLSSPSVLLFCSLSISSHFTHFHPFLITIYHFWHERTYKFFSQGRP